MKYDKNGKSKVNGYIIYLERFKDTEMALLKIQEWVAKHEQSHKTSLNSLSDLLYI